MADGDKPKESEQPKGVLANARAAIEYGRQRHQNLELKRATQASLWMGLRADLFDFQRMRNELEALQLPKEHGGEQVLATVDAAIAKVKDRIESAEKMLKYLNEERDRAVADVRTQATLVLAVAAFILGVCNLIWNIVKD